GGCGGGQPGGPPGGGLAPAPRAGPRRDLARQPPCLDEVLSRRGPRGQVQCAGGVLSRAGGVATSHGELAETDEQPDRVAEAHPFARRGRASEAEHVLEIFLRETQVPARQENFTQVERGVWEGPGVVALAPNFRAALVEVDGDVEIAELRVEPAETVEQAMMDRLVADSLGQCQP